MRDLTAILDIGSSTIVALIGERGVNNTFKISGKGEISYAGFLNSTFLEQQNLKYVIATAISNAEISSESKISEIYIGVPGEFCACTTKKISLDFPKIKKISEFDIMNIYRTGNDFKAEKEFELINQSAIYFDIDGTKRVINPLGLKAKSVTGNISYVFANRNFVNLINMIFSELKITIKGFISSTLAECLYLFEPETRDKYALLVDVGYITTNVAISRGNGLLYLNSFSLGGGYITSDLSECLKISFSEAEHLKHKVVLGWNASQTDTYEIAGEQKMQSCSAKATNEIVADRIDMICSYILKSFESCDYDLPEFLPIYVTGGGFNYLKGIKSILSQKLKRHIELISPNVPNMNRPDLSSEVGLLNIVINNLDLIEII